MITKIKKNQFLVILLFLVLLGQLNAYNIRTLQSNSSSTCASRKDDLIFYDADLDQCISKSACKKFLIGVNTCTATCPLGYYSYEDRSSNNNYIVCSSSCKNLSIETISEPLYCHEDCIQYKVDSTTYCRECPPEFPYANKQADGTKYYYNCSTKPDQNLIQLSDSMQYVFFQDCYQFVVDNQRCAFERPSNCYVYKKIQGNNYQLCSSTCQYLIRDNDESYYCQDSCDGSLFKTINASGNSISYCNTCPEDLPIMSVINSKEHTCSSCRKDQISNISTNSCLDKKEDCSGYVTNGTTCKKSCDSRMFTYPTFLQYKRCETECAPTYLTDQSNRKCYASSNECPLLISSDGKRCLGMCNQGEYPVVIDGKSKCVWCNDFVQSGFDNKGNYIAKCVTTCDSGNLPQQQIYGIKYKFCQANVTYQDMWVIPSTGIYVYKCLFPEVGLANFTCASSCPESYKLRLENQACVEDCPFYEFLSSDQTLCLKSCAWNFEVQNDNNRNCKKCNPDEIFLFVSKKGKCVKYDNSDDTLAKIKQSISDIYTDLFLLNSKYTQNLINKQVSTYQNMVMSRLAEIADKQAKTADDQEKAKNTFSQALDMAKAQLKSAGTFLDKPILTCNNYYNIISQSYPTYQTSKAFNLSLDFESLQNCKVSDLLKEITDPSQTVFTPQQLLVSYIKKNHFCIGDDCKDSPSLITVSYPTNQTKSRILAAGAQEFSVIYSIPAEQSKEKQACFNYDINGVLTVSQGQIQGTQIVCKFTSSSGLIYDPTCKFLDKSICDPPKPSESEQPSQPGQPSKPQQPQDQIKSASSNSEKLNGAAIAGIVIGAVTALIIVGVGLACYIRKNKLTKKYEVNYTENNNNQVKETEECNLKQIYQITNNQQQTDIIN